MNFLLDIKYCTIFTFYIVHTNENGPQNSTTLHL